MLLMGMTLHTVDIGAQARKNELAMKWCGLAHEEFFAQGDAESSMGMIVSQCCDRNTTDINKSQVRKAPPPIAPIAVSRHRSFNRCIQAPFIPLRSLNATKSPPLIPASLHYALDHLRKLPTIALVIISIFWPSRARL